MAGRPMATPKRFVRSSDANSHAIATSPDPSRNALAVGVEELDSRADANPLLAFSSEPHGAIPDGPLEELTARVRRAAESNRDETKVSARRPPAGSATNVRKWAMGAGLCALVALTAYALWTRHTTTAPVVAVPQTGTAIIHSRPDGLPVTIDGVVRGRTPLKLSLPLGEHALQIQYANATRSLPLAIEQATTVSQHVDFAVSDRAPSPAGGRLDVTSEPPGSPVKVDGAAAGTTPLVLDGLKAGNHKIIVGSGDTAFKRTVTVVPGATASIVASVGQGAASGGWLMFKAPFDMTVFEDGRQVGTTSADRLMLPTGTHRLELVSRPLEFRTTTSVQVGAGKMSTVTVPVPNGSLSVNALPWANIEIDGRPVGTTPLGSIALSVGSHEVVWKHPRYGERRQTVMVTATSPVRIGMDLSE
jgi:hypothetical protein